MNLYDFVILYKVLIIINKMNKILVHQQIYHVIIQFYKVYTLKNWTKLSTLIIIINKQNMFFITPAIHHYSKKYFKYIYIYNFDFFYIQCNF